MIFMTRRFVLSVLLLSTPMLASAETAYVIDKLLVGIHADKTLDSPIVKVFQTGTQFEVLKREGDLAQVKGPDGVTGWVDTSYLTDEQPAAAVVEQIEAQNRQLVENLKAAEAKAADLEAKLAKVPATGGNLKPNEQIEKLRKDNEELQQTLSGERARSSDLQNKLTELRQQPKPAADSSVIEMLQHENDVLKQELEQARQPAEAPRAETAGDAASGLSWLPAAPQFLSHGLKVFGKFVSSPQVLLAALVLLLAASFGGGIYFMDMMHRRRHGGFRI